MIIKKKFHKDRAWMKSILFKLTVLAVISMQVISLQLRSRNLNELSDKVDSSSKGVVKSALSMNQT